MKQSLQVCSCILSALLCLLVPSYLHATQRIVKDLFQEQTKHIGKKDFVEDAVFLSLNQEILTDIYQANDSAFTLRLPFENGKELQLHLKQAHYLGADFQVKVQKGTTHSTLFYSPALFYRGAINGKKDAFVALNFFKDKVTGVLTVNGQNYNIGRYEKEGENSFVLYKEANLNISNPFECSTEDPEYIKIERSSSSSRSNPNSTVKIYIECDHHLYKNMGSNASRVTDFTTGLFNVVASLYQQESINLEISEIKIWSSPDPYTTSSAKNARNDFASKLGGNFNGDVAHLLSNYKVNGSPPNGGSANIDVLCNKSKAVSYTNITTSYLDFPTFSWTAYAVTHEIGHNLGSPHTHSCLWPTGPIDNCWCPEGGCDLGPEPASSGTMMSYCHLDPKWTSSCSLSSSNPGISFSAGFGQQPGDLIRSRINDASCLSGASGPTTSTQRLSVSLQAQEESCSGKKDGTIIATARNGVAPYSYRWSNGKTTSTITSLAAGSFSVTVTDGAGKTANASTTVAAGSTVKVDAGPDKVLGCGSNEVILDASNSAKGFQYRDVWTKVGGSINGSVNGSIYNPLLTVTEPGTYRYTITNEDTGCSASDEVVVTKVTNTTTVQISGGTITCNRASIQLNVQTENVAGTYHWTGPNSFLSIEKAPIVQVPGLYQLLIKYDNGCSSTGQVQIESEVASPTVYALGGVIDCNHPTVQLQGSSNQSVTYQWTGPNGFSSNVASPTTSLSGQYTLVVSNASGCTNSTVAQVGQSVAPPQVSVVGGELTCTVNQIQLKVTTNNNDLDYRWTGPNGFLSKDQQPFVSVPGNYTLSVTSNTGCSTLKSVTVSAQTAVPSFQIQAEPLSCAQSSTYLEIITVSALHQVRWNGPNGYTSNELKPLVSQSGVYTLTVWGQNGCAATAAFQLNESQDIPDFQVSAIPLSCNLPTTILNVDLISQDYDYVWTGPNGFLSYEIRPSVNIVGTYTLKITGQNGCSALQSVAVANNLAMPQVQATATDISCQSGTAQLFAQSSDNTDRFYWSGPNNFQSTDKNPVVTSAGVYSLTTIGTNGCVNEQTVQVQGRTLEVANISTQDEHCGNSDGSIKIEMANPNDTYEVSWSTGHRGLHLPFVPAGNYSAIITNSAGCATSISTTVLPAADIRLLTLNTTDISCYNANDGSIAVGITGGVTPYNLLWSNGTIGAVNTNLAHGMHTLEVEDAIGCVRTFFFELKNPEPLEVITEIGEDEAEFFVSGGEPTYLFQWSNGLSGAREIGLISGAYQVTISDANGCSLLESFSIASIDIMESSIGELIEVELPTVPPVQDQLISPNPADSYFNLYHKYEQSELVFISVFNAQGYYLFRKTIETDLINERVETTNWENGTYYVQLLTKNGFITKELKVVHN